MGDFIEQARPAAVRILAEEGPDAVRDVMLGRAPVAFDRKPDGELSLALEGGHSLHRIIHAADATGKSIEVALIRALESEIERFYRSQALTDDLIGLRNAARALRLLSPMQPGPTGGAPAATIENKPVQRSCPSQNRNTSYFGGTNPDPPSSDVNQSSWSCSGTTSPKTSTAGA